MESELLKYRKEKKMELKGNFNVTIISTKTDAEIDFCFDLIKDATDFAFNALCHNPNIKIEIMYSPKVCS